MPIECSGCSSGHIANAVVLLKEFKKFIPSDEDLAILHLNEAIGNLRQAEEQQPDEYLRGELRQIRKEVESSIAVSGVKGLVTERVIEGNKIMVIDDMITDLQEVGVGAIKYLEAHPETCPTCMSMLKDGESEESGVVELPMYQIKGKRYYRDVRLQEYRNVKNPSDIITFDEFDRGNMVLETPTDNPRKKGTRPMGLTAEEKAHPEILEKVESCISQVKAQQPKGCEKKSMVGKEIKGVTCVNPFAVCRASVEGK